MPWNDRTGPVPRRTEDEMLALVREKSHAAGARRGAQLRSMGTAAAMLLVVALGTVVTRIGTDPTTQLRTTSGDIAASSSTPQTTYDSLPPSSTSTSVVPSTIPPLPKPMSTVTTSRPPSSPSVSTTRPPATTSSTAGTPVCRNSVDPACGPFRWDPLPPPNQPLTAKVTYTPSTPKAGETVTFRVVVDDPDGSRFLDTSGIANNYGDAPPEGGVGGHADCIARFGPWTPDASQPIHADLTFRHVYANPGTYTVSLPFGSLGDCTYARSEAVATTTVTVSP